MIQPPFPSLINFLAASRKPMLKDAGLMSPGDNLTFIWSETGGSSGAPVALTGTINGLNRVFTIPTLVINGVSIFRNGILQDPAISYVLSFQTVTFTVAPVSGDDLQAIVL